MTNQKGNKRKFKAYYFKGDYYSYEGEQRYTTVIYANNENEAENIFKIMYQNCSFGWIDEIEEVKKSTIDTIKNQAIINTIINNKMRVLDDFNICDKDDPEMRSKLDEVIAENPDKDPVAMLDYFCRPIIKAKADSWI